MNSINYFQKRNNENNKKLRMKLLELPNFSNEFFLGISDITTPLTRLGYAQDLKVFFNFLIKNTTYFQEFKSIQNITLESMNKLKSDDIEQFLNYLDLYEYNGKNYTNSKNTKARKISTLRRFLGYYFKKDKINSNVAMKVNLPKVSDKDIIRLEINEVSDLLNNIEQGNSLTKRQKSFHKHTVKRDLAILTLLLGTGIRISECVGLNVNDLDFDNHAFTVTRKGGNKSILYFSDEVEKALQEYLKYRNKIKDIPKDENALFLSIQKKRMSVRAMEKMVKKYSKTTTPLKNITPHKLRSTYGTNLYRETNDIYVVADVLGHKDVNTTKKHYAAISDNIRKKAANKIKLRDEK